MDSSPGAVKRRYDTTRRRARADDARRRVLDAAQRLFLHGGYAATTMAAVAAEAGVSVESVYKAHGSKARLVLAVFHHAIRGDARESAEERADRISVHEADPVRRLRGFGAIVGAVTARVAPLMLLVSAAAGADEELAAAWQQMQAERLERMAGHARRLADGGHLRAGVTVDEARDVFWLFTAPEVYDLMVGQRGWSTDRFGAWVGDAYVAALLEPHARTASSGPAV
ncbi:TetR/AcrR family transcriptional regulator [Blastococcus jejuensis]|uniref:TetR/AcrR family transcriptional regulator n=1 Tax=Blastococcus jejuensis TaxID=351224 RepID=A0ABP6NUF0_9ACTN